MGERRRRRPGTRLILTLAALASLIAGYYLGQHWQRRPMANLSAVLYPTAQAVDYPAALAVPVRADVWRLVLVADTRAEACHALVRHFAFVRNRLAASPEIQAALRLTLLAYDRPDAAAIDAFRGTEDWIEVISGDPPVLDRLSGALGIQPAGSDWCTPTAANAILVSPAQEAWALIPYGQAAMMARNIRTIIAFVE